MASDRDFEPDRPERHDPLTCELCHGEGVSAELVSLRAENERLRAGAFTTEEIKLMAREISGMCDHAADGGSIPPVLWRRLANKLDRLARAVDETDLPKEI